MADVEVDDEHEEEILGLPDEPRPIDPLACRPKFWKMFFAMQIVFVVSGFTLCRNLLKFLIDAEELNELPPLVTLALALFPELCLCAFGTIRM